jgi:hypothetical protein
LVFVFLFIKRFDKTYKLTAFSIFRDNMDNISGARGTKSLLDLSMEYDVVLMDSSAFCNPLSKKRKGKLGQLTENRRILRYVEGVQGLVESDLPIYITQGIFNECSHKGSFRYIKLIKSEYAQCHARERLSLRLKRDTIKTRRRICRILSDTGRVIDFGDKKFHGYDDALETVGYLRKNGAGDEDLELLAVSSVLAEDGLSVALLSNDMRHIKRGYLSLLRANPTLDPERFKFYAMVKQGEFCDDASLFRKRIDSTREATFISP